MLTFKEAFSSVNKAEATSILLANGFSRAFDDDIFDYKSLLDAADFGAREDALKLVFQRMETFDFEVVMSHLVAAESVLDVYGVDDATLEQLREDKGVLKDALISAISTTHPDLPSKVSPEQYEAVVKFLHPFQTIFTLNYDLLLYWAVNKKEIKPRPRAFKVGDGFRFGDWMGNSVGQRVHFLHGCLHIYDTDTFIKKAQNIENGEVIVEQVRAKLGDGEFPLFVSEPTHEKKKNRIEHSPYLNYCFEELRKLKGVLFIYGHSIEVNDKHIFDQIKLSDVSDVFVSIYGNEGSDENIRTKANAMAFLEGKGIKVSFYQAESAPVWA
jgi:hypothetical protein